jgi:hypothetical protein
MKGIRKKIIILLSLLLSFIIICLFFNNSIEGMEEDGPSEGEKDCDEYHTAKTPSWADCKVAAKRKARAKKKAKEAKAEAKKIKDEMGMGAPAYECPEITSFNTFIIKAYCLAKNIRTSAQDV